jgi:hypothetical protein
LLKVIPSILDLYIKAPNNLPTTSTFHKITIRKTKGQGTYQKSYIIDAPPSSLIDSTIVATPLWAKCEDEIHIPKSGVLESSGTPATSELDNRGQNTSP